MKPADRLAAELQRLGMFPPLDQRPYLKALVQIRGEAVTMTLADYRRVAQPEVAYFGKHL